MTHTYANQFIHILFTTKNLESSICEDTLDHLRGYIGSIIAKLGGQCIATGGTTNHIHLLINLPTNNCTSSYLSQIKSCASKWYRQLELKNAYFEWNDGYLAFTVSPESICNIKDYFSNERNRHHTTTAKDEILQFLKFQEVDFKPQYVTTTSYSRLIYHLIWSVKNRLPLLEKKYENAMHHHLIKEAEANKVKVYAVGSTRDHVHLLVECSRTSNTANVVNKLKTSTTYFLRQQALASKPFIGKKAMVFLA